MEELIVFVFAQCQPLRFCPPQVLLLSYFGGAQNRAVKDMSDDELVAAVSCMSVEPWSGWLAGSLGPSGGLWSGWLAAWVAVEAMQ